MEAEAFEYLLPKLMKCGKIRQIIKEGDTKLQSIIDKHGLKIQIKHDPNHLKKNWVNSFTKFNKLANGTLRGLKDKIMAHLNYCLYSKLFLFCQE